jgi:hypothetical protein
MRVGWKGLALLAAFATLVGAAGASADDRWETTSVPGGDDDDSTTANELVVGARQLHDVQGTVVPGSFSDVDWMYVQTRAGHSYEVRTSSTNVSFDSQVGFCALCARVDRVNATGQVLTAGFPPEGEGPVSGAAQSFVVRWIGTADQRDWIRFRGDGARDQTANDQYEIELQETTYFVPRWNQSGTQSTVLLIQNTSSTTVLGTILFYDAGGALLASTPLFPPEHGVQVLPLASIPVLLGQSGSAAIVHLGGSGALAGKAVALEPATGFTFDTPIAPRSR